MEFQGSGRNTSTNPGSGAPSTTISCSTRGHRDCNPDPRQGENRSILFRQARSPQGTRLEPPLLRHSSQIDLGQQILQHLVGVEILSRNLTGGAAMTWIIAID